MEVSQKSILRRHRDTLQGRLRLFRMHAPSLGIAKPFYVYEPPGYDRTHPRHGTTFLTPTDVRPVREGQPLVGARRATPADPEGLPILYLFRGHEREWVNFKEDHSRHRTTAIEDLDRRIVDGSLPPLIAVMPGLNSTNNHVPSLGIDMVGTWPATLRGLGTGRFWQYLAGELIPYIEATYGREGGPRLATGFSLGGFTVSLLSFLLPGYLDHAGIYDGLLMWPLHGDPRQGEGGSLTDPLWVRAGIFDPAFGKPRDHAALERWNPTDRLALLDAETRALVEKTTFWIQCAGADGSKGNRDRAVAFVKMLRDQRLRVGFDQVILSEDAEHSWHWNDRFLTGFLDAALGVGEIAER